VCAEVVTIDTTGLTAGDAKATTVGGEMPVNFAKPTIILVAMEVSICMNACSRRFPT